jgi:tRNA nucleotidyltransferase/poly(A) polymerase
VKTFEEFAKKCMRAFVVHMRDDPWEVDYAPVKPSDYEAEQVKRLAKELKEIETKDETKLWNAEVKRIKSSIQDYARWFEERCQKNARLEAMLQRAKAFVPPTERHASIKDFMIQQLEISNENSDYCLRCIEDYNKTLQAGMPKDYKKNLIADKKQELKRAKEAYAAEVARCEANNKWCDEFLRAIKEVEE